MEVIQLQNEYKVIQWTGQEDRYEIKKLLADNYDLFEEGNKVSLYRNNRKEVDLKLGDWVCADIFGVVKVLSDESFRKYKVKRL